MAAGADQRIKQLYEFGPFRIDPEKELLFRGGETVPLTPKAFQVLLVLVRHSKDVVTKDDLMKMVWPDSFVEEANLSRNIFLLRKALGESPQDHQYIVTVPGRGYRFTGDVQLVPEQDLSMVAASHAKVEVEIKGRPHKTEVIAIFAVLVVIAAAASFAFWKIPPGMPRDGKHIFTIGTEPRGELVRYDRATKQFVPFLGGISAIDPSFSRGGQRVAYTSSSDHTLWRSRADGTDRLQLTFPPMQVAWPVISQDGRQVAFQVIGDGGYVISTNGGQPRRVADKNSEGGSLSPDGNSIAFAVWIEGTQGGTWELRTLNLTNGALSGVRSSQNVIGPFWVNRNTLVAAAGDVVPAQGPAVEWTKLVSFNLKTGKWTDLVSDAIVNWMPSPDGKYLYYATGGTEPKAMRIRLADRQVETLTSLKTLRRFWDFVEGGTQISVAPDGSPVFTAARTTF